MTSAHDCAPLKPSEAPVAPAVVAGEAAMSLCRGDVEVEGIADASPVTADARAAHGVIIGAGFAPAGKRNWR